MLGSDVLFPSSHGYSAYLKAWIFIFCTLLTIFLLFLNTEPPGNKMQMLLNYRGPDTLPGFRSGGCFS